MFVFVYDIKPKAINITQNGQKKSSSQSNYYTRISIGYDFSNLQRPNSMGTWTFEKVKSLLKETRLEFSKILQVQHQNIELNDYFEKVKDACHIDKIGDDYNNFLIKNDLIIFPMFNDLDDEILAAAAPCLTDEDHRPLAGMIYLNSKLNFEITNTNLYMKNLLFHVITHLLGFHSFFIQNLKMYNAVSNGDDTKYYIISKKVLDKAREHFDCSTLPGIPLENQEREGSVGDHWESRYMLGDYMISNDFPEQAISDITLAFLEDTGFYKVNYY